MRLHLFSFIHLDHKNLDFGVIQTLYLLTGFPRGIELKDAQPS